MRLLEMMLAWDWREVLGFWLVFRFMGLNTYCICLLGSGDGIGWRGW